MALTSTLNSPTTGSISTSPNTPLTVSIAWVAYSFAWTVYPFTLLRYRLDAPAGARARRLLSVGALLLIGADITLGLLALGVLS